MNDHCLNQHLPPEDEAPVSNKPIIVEDIQFSKRPTANRQTLVDIIKSLAEKTHTILQWDRVQNRRFATQLVISNKLKYFGRSSDRTKREELKVVLPFSATSWNDLDTPDIELAMFKCVVDVNDSYEWYEVQVHLKTFICEETKLLVDELEELDNAERESSEQQRMYGSTREHVNPPIVTPVSTCESSRPEISGPVRNNTIPSSLKKPTDAVLTKKCPTSKSHTLDRPESSKGTADEPKASTPVQRKEANSSQPRPSTSHGALSRAQPALQQSPRVSLKRKFPDEQTAAHVSSEPKSAGEAILYENAKAQSSAQQKRRPGRPARVAVPTHQENGPSREEHKSNARRETGASTRSQVKNAPRKSTPNNAEVDNDIEVLYENIACNRQSRRETQTPSLGHYRQSTLFSRKSC